MAALDDIAAERLRQKEAEGWDDAHDDRYRFDELIDAALCYFKGNPQGWPWDPAWWKPGSLRRNLVKAGALAQAEMDLWDRRWARAGSPPGPRIMWDRARQLRDQAADQITRLDASGASADD